MTDANDSAVNKPRPTDWSSKDKSSHNELAKHLPLGLAMLLSSMPGLVALFSDRPTRAEVAVMITQGPYSRDESHIKATLTRVENNHAEVSKNSVELSKAIVSVSTQMTLITSEIQALRKDVSTLREWWFVPPKPKPGEVLRYLLWPVQSPIQRIAHRDYRDSKRKG